MKQRIGGLVISKDTRDIVSRTSGTTHKHLGLGVRFDEADNLSPEYYARMISGEDMGISALTIDQWASDVFIDQMSMVTPGEWIVLDCNPVRDESGHIRWNITNFSTSATEAFYAMPVIENEVEDDFDLEDEE